MISGRYLCVMIIALLFSSCRENPADDHMMDRYNWVSEVRIMNVDGTKDHAFTSDRKHVVFANYLPNGQKIILVQEGVMYSINPDGTQKAAIITNYGFSYSLQNNAGKQWFQFTKDSKKIIFSLAKDDRYAREIHTVNIDGTGEINLTGQGELKRLIQNFALSPDNRAVVYAEYWPDSSHANSISMVNIDGTNKHVVKTFGFSKPMNPQFHPTDNSAIVYQLDEGYWKGTSLNRVSLSDTSNVKMLKNDTRAYPIPCISPLNKIFLQSLTYPYTMMSIGFETGEERTIAIALPYGFMNLSFSNDGSRLLIADAYQNYAVSDNDGTGMQYYKFPNQDSNIQKADPYLSPDNQQIIYRTVQLVLER